MLDYTSDNAVSSQYHTSEFNAVIKPYSVSTQYYISDNAVSNRYYTRDNAVHRNAVSSQYYTSDNAVSSQYYTSESLMPVPSQYYTSDNAVSSHNAVSSLYYTSELYSGIFYYPHPVIKRSSRRELRLLTVYPLYLNRLLGVYGNFSGCMEIHNGHMASQSKSNQVIFVGGDNAVSHHHIAVRTV
ncbi:hypothetical protein DPMN_194257 [Dreissena polymorpha]|uniref:Uncharacterized protein n=1 Tax=Dreissena polymorpha TaxID=45954 RepID=A0A9D4B7T0_DREPO|nr:hypothetical protein DPMN_194257 [Dreissena polymorpha]